MDGVPVLRAVCARAGILTSSKTAQHQIPPFPLRERPLLTPHYLRCPTLVPTTPHIKDYTRNCEATLHHRTHQRRHAVSPAPAALTTSAPSISTFTTVTSAPRPQPPSISTPPTSTTSRSCSPPSTPSNAFGDNHQSIFADSRLLIRSPENRMDPRNKLDWTCVHSRLRVLGCSIAVPEPAVFYGG